MKKQIALLSNVTMDMLVQKLKKDFDIYMPAGFDTWGQEIIDTNSGLYGQKHDAVFLILDGMEARHWKDREEAFDKLELWDKLIRKLVERISDIPVFISTVDVKENRIKAVSERIYRFEWENTWYQRIQELSEQRSNVLVFDVNQIIGDIGRDNFYSEKMWYMGSMPYAKAGLQALQKEIKLLMNSAFGEKRKAIVVDFDNTLWGGVIGEDGVEGIQLSDHKEGERFYNLQHQLYEMKKRGVLLAAASKNNESDVEGVWEHPAMLLKKEDFVSRKINWEGKPLNVREMEKELNLTEGSFAFLDDNPAERNAMLAQCPEVLVLDYPEDTTQLSECAEAFYKAYFRPLAITAEDIQKTDLYLTEAKRQKEKVKVWIWMII